jgi:selenide,water dikinase
MHVFLTMNNQPKQKLVLIGAGHANIQVLHGFSQLDRTSLDLILISDVLNAPYSGMIPSYLAGDCVYSELHFDLKKICDRFGFQFVHDQVIAIDSKNQIIRLQSGPPISYDLVSLNVGIQPQSITSQDQKSVLHVKPISGLIEKWKSLEHLTESSIISVVGGGAGAFEIAVACRRRFSGIKVQLIAGDGGLLPSLNVKSQALAKASLNKLNIQLFEGSRVQEHLDGALKLKSGKLIPTTISLLATSAKVPDWFKTSGLPTNSDGFIQVQSDLLAIGCKNLFAAGDCCEFANQSLPKAGVFAVKQGPILLENMKSIIQKIDRLQNYQPQKNFLTILVSGNKTAIASKGSWAFEGRLPWILKNWIDRRFMKRFS